MYLAGLGSLILLLLGGCTCCRCNAKRRRARKLAQQQLEIEQENSARNLGESAGGLGSSSLQVIADVRPGLGYSSSSSQLRPVSTAGEHEDGTGADDYAGLPADTGDDWEDDDETDIDANIAFGLDAEAVKAATDQNAALNLQWKGGMVRSSSDQVDKGLFILEEEEPSVSLPNDNDAHNHGDEFESPVSHEDLSSVENAYGALED